MNLFIGTSSVDTLDKNILDSCNELIEKIAKIKDVNLVYGAYNHGIMGKCYEEFRKNDKKVTAITVNAFEDELNKIECEDKKVEETTFDRIKKIYKKSDMFLILPGGIGTLSELFSIIEEMKTNENDKMLILYNKDFFYKDIIEKLYNMYENKLVQSAPSEYMLISNDIDEILTVIENF